MAHSPQPADHSRQVGTLPRVLSAVGCRLRALFGMPDYARYLAHQRRRHPGAPVLTEKEFVRAELERRYGGGVSRCC